MKAMVSALCDSDTNEVKLPEPSGIGVFKVGHHLEPAHIYVNAVLATPSAAKCNVAAGD